MAEVPSPAPDVARVFVGVGIGHYKDPAFATLGAVREVRAVAELLAARGFTVTVVENVSDARAEQRLIEALPQGGLVGGTLVVLWAGHGERTATGELRLITTNARPQVAATRTARQVVDLAMRTGASQIMVILDTCFAGGGIPSASTVVEGLREAFPDPSGWVGVLASSRSFEYADDDLFGSELVRVLSEGPRNLSLQSRFHAFEIGIRGDDVIDVLKQEWPSDRQRPDDRQSGTPQVMFLNPLYRPETPEEVVEHLLLAAEGRSPDETGSYFSGRRRPLQKVVQWLERSVPGVMVVTGAPGCGKSAVVGRLVMLSNPEQRRLILSQVDDPGPDPGEGSIHAHVHARLLTVDGVAATINTQLSHQGLIPASERRNMNDLLGVIQRETEADTLPVPLRVVVDGVDEADREAEPIVVDVVSRLAQYAQVLVATRAIAGADGRDLIETMSTVDPLDLSAPERAEDTADDLRTYVRSRLRESPGSMDPTAVADYLLSAEPGVEGAFLLARLVTSQLRDTPLDTGVAEWESGLATSLESAFDRDLTSVEGDTPQGVAGPRAARDILTALAWGYGEGVPDDVWQVIAAALPDAAAPYGRDDVYWALQTLGRYVVASRSHDTAAYRITHRGLSQHLRPPRLMTEQLEHDPATLPVATAIVDYYQSLLDSGVAPETHRYLWLHTWQHCTDAGRPGIDLIRGLTEARPVFRRDLAASLNDLGARYSEVGRDGEGVPPTEEAAAIYRELAEENQGVRGDLAMALTNLGISYGEVGRQVEALAPTKEAVDIRRDLADADPGARADLASSLNTLGNVYSKVGQPSDAVAPTEEAVDIRRDLAQTSPAARADLASSLTTLGMRYSEVGRPVQALAPTEEAVNILRELNNEGLEVRSRLASSLNSLGARYSDVGRQVDAVAPTEEAVSIRRDLAETNPAALSNLAMSLANLGTLYAEMGRQIDAVGPTEEAVDIHRELAKTNPGQLDDLASSLNSLGIRYSEVGRQVEAVTCTEEAVDIHRGLVEANPGARGDLAMSLANLGVRYREMGRRDEAVAPTEEAVTIYRELAKTNPGTRDDLASSLNNLGGLYISVQRWVEAVARIEEAVTIRRELTETNPGARGDLASALNNLGTIYHRAQRWDDAVAATEEAVTIYRQLAETNPGLRDDLASALNNLGVIFSGVNRWDDALSSTEEAARIRRKLVKANAAFHGDLAASLNNLGVIHSNAQRWDKAAKVTLEAVRVYRKLAETNPAAREDLALALANLGTRYREAGRTAQAVAPTEEAVTIYQQLAAANPTTLGHLAQSLTNLELLYAALGRTAETEGLWQSACESVETDGRAELRIRRAKQRTSPSDAVEDLTAAEPLTEGVPRLSGFLHDVARRTRALDPVAFDAAWLRLHEMVPEWLTLDLDHYTLVATWAGQPTRADEAAFASAHATELLEGPTSLAIAELGLLVGSPDEVMNAQNLLDDARERGFAAVYEPLIAREIVDRYLHVGREEQITMLAEQREQVVTPAALAALAELTSNDGTGGFGVGLLQLAAQNLDTRVLDALGDAPALAAIVDETISSGKPDTVLALARVMIDDTASGAQATGYLVAACGMVLADEPDDAIQAIRTARRLSEATVQSFLSRLVTLVAVQPKLATLAAAFTQPAPIDEEP